MFTSGLLKKALSLTNCAISSLRCLMINSGDQRFPFHIIKPNYWSEQFINYVIYWVIVILDHENMGVAQEM